MWQCPVWLGSICVVVLAVGVLRDAERATCIANNEISSFGAIIAQHSCMHTCVGVLWNVCCVCGCVVCECVCMHVRTCVCVCVRV